MEPITGAAETGFIEELCLTCRVPLHHYLTQMVGNREIAWELAQESFEHAHRAYGAGDVMFPRAALFTVATNLALRHIRRRREEQGFYGNPIDKTHVEEVVADYLASPFDRQVLPAQIQNHLAAVIKALRPTLRYVFVMAHLQGKSRKDIAVALCISEKRVDKRMAKALSVCRERLASQGIDLANLC